MKKLMIPLLVAASLALSACGGGKIDGVDVPSYGLVNQDSRKQDGIKYEISAASVIWAIILSETIIIPIYIVGWDLFKPVGKAV